MKPSDILNTFAATGMHELRKHASAVTDAIGSVVYDQIPLASAAQNIGEFHGLLTDVTDKDIQDLNYRAGLAALPGVGSSRFNRRIRRVTRDKEGHNPQLVAQTIGKHTANILPSLLGGGVGGVTGAAIGNAIGGGEGAIPGAILGAIGGAGIATGIPKAVALLAALLTKTRTKEQQEAYANGSVWPNYIIPGMATYNEWKSYGRAIEDEKEQLEAQKDTKNDKEEEEEKGKKEASFRRRISSIYA